jgi:hypothetical protein
VPDRILAASPINDEALGLIIDQVRCFVDDTREELNTQKPA